MQDLIQQYSMLHASNWGEREIEFIHELFLIIDYLKPKSILDYGCGAGNIMALINQHYPQIKVYGYDPAIEERSVLPVKKADLVINTDVLEHIPESELPEVVAQIASISQNVYFHLHHALATTILPNGENAHCTVKPPEWYFGLLGKQFDIIKPLKGRYPFLSVVLTFLIPDTIEEQYNGLISPNTKPVMSMESAQTEIPQIENVQTEVPLNEQTAKKDDCTLESLNKIENKLEVIHQSQFYYGIAFDYYRYRILSKITFGKRRGKYLEKKRIYREKTKSLKSLVIFNMELQKV